MEKMIKVVKLAYEIINGEYQWQIFISLYYTYDINKKHFHLEIDMQ